MDPRPTFLSVYPRNPETYWSYRHALRFVGKRALMPPLGLATVAAMVPDHYTCRILDMNIEPFRDSEISVADLVLISGMIVQSESMAPVINRCRRLGTKVAAGGPYPTSASERIDGVDYFILGEAEVTFPQFLRDYEAGTPQQYYRSEFKPSLRDTPVPRFDLLALQQYESVPIQFSRGCPYDCEFCDIVQLFGRAVRSKPPQRFIAEMEAVLATGFRGSMFVGLESPVEDSLVAAGKQQNLRWSIADGVRAIQQRGIEVTGGFIIGFDSDPTDIFERQIRFVQQLAIPVAMVRQTFSRYGLHYLHYMARAIRLRPPQMVQIFTKAIQGHHHTTVTRSMFPRHRPQHD